MSDRDRFYGVVETGPKTAEIRANVMKKSTLHFSKVEFTFMGEKITGFSDTEFDPLTVHGGYDSAADREARREWFYRIFDAKKGNADGNFFERAWNNRGMKWNPIG